MTTSHISPSPSPSSATSYGASTVHSPLIDSANAPSILSTSSEVLGAEPDSSINQPSDVDPQILEALRSKDRLYVLKLGELMEGLINERRARVELAPSTSYQRLLVHRCSAYYKLQPESDPVTKGIAALLTADSRIPARRICELVPAESTAQPAFKIMRRSVQDRSRGKPQSHTGSVAGEDADLSDVEPSESGSAGGRSNATGGSNKKRMTIEEREAAYKEARSRIFMGFEEKEKEKDMNASSSSLSLVSGSASTSGGTAFSSVDDFEDSVSSPATESEWSGSIARDKKDGKGNASASSSRSLRSTAPPFNANGPGSSRGSRAPSPSFTYASLYEPSVSSSPYDPGQVPGQAPSPGYIAQYIYPYPPPGQPPHPPYVAPYQVYAPYPYQQGMLPNPEVPASTGGPLYSPSHPVGYDNPYAWSHPPQPPPPMQHPPPQPQPRQTLYHPNTPLLQNPVPYQAPYMPPPSPYSPYPMPSYYPPPSQPEHHMQQPIPHVAPQPVFPGETPRSMNGNGLNHVVRNVQMNGNSTGTNSSRTSSRNSTGTSINGGKRNTAPPARSAWSYSPGFVYGGTGPTSGLSIGSSGIGGSDPAVGPRLSSSMRRGSGTSVGSTGNWASAGDEASSTASSSTTSSSSRRTFTSSSSHHPLPARPDWAVGLKPQPTLHPTHPRHHDPSRSDWTGGVKLQSSQRNPISMPRNTSPGRNEYQPQICIPQQMSPTRLQSTDFPPLSSATSPPEKRTPVVAGAWTNSSTRSILMTSPGPVNSSGSTALIHHPNSNGGPNSTVRPEDADRGTEKLQPKGSADSFNPKVVRRPGSIPQVPDRAEQDNTDVVASAILVGQVISLSLDDASTDPAKESSVVIFPT